MADLLAIVISIVLFAGLFLLCSSFEVLRRSASDE